MAGQARFLATLLMNQGAVLVLCSLIMAQDCWKSEYVVHRVFGDTLGRFHLSPVSTGKHVVMVRGIGYLPRDIPTIVHGDTARLGVIRLIRNPKADSFRVVVPP